jgi:hypothetical protein
MPLPPESRLTDMYRALELMTHEVGDNPMYLGYFDADKEPYAGTHPTTWRELEDRRLVTDTGHRIYQLTGRGWLAGIRSLKYPDDPQFREKMSKLSATLKKQLQGRQEDALVDIYALERESGVSTGFIYNAIKSRLLDEEFRIKGASFAPDDHNENHVIIPLNYGERHLAEGPR